MATQLLQPTYGSLAWVRQMIEAGKDEKSIHPVMITPSMATQFLMLNVSNRGIRPKKVEQIRRAIKAGLFRGMNGETIKFKKDGTLGDGQHRLTAIAAEASDVTTYIMFGADQEDIDTVDQGAARTAADIVRLEGGEHAPERAAIARLLIGFEESDGASIGRISSVSNAEIVRRANTDPMIMKAASWASTHGRRAPGLPGSVISFCYYVFSAISVAEAEKYLDQICKGVELKPRDPAMTVRDYLIRRMKNDQRARANKIESIFRGWNAFREGRPFSQVVTTGSLPELV